MTSKDKMRDLLAREAARLMAEEGIENPLRARSKAAARLGCTDRRRWPGSDEIDTALLEHRRIFEAETQPMELLRLRTLAIEAMEFLREFAPDSPAACWTVPPVGTAR
ncbi:MAG TPA: hypothetical protein VNL74_09955 [Methylococcus sp.]|nr:hypothetical protein [Methylococcus sp.]